MTDIAEPQPLDIGRVVQETFQILGRHFIPFFILALILVGIPRAVLGVAQVTTLRAAVASMNFGGPGLYWSFLGFLVSVTTSAILQATIISGSASDMNGRPVSVGESLSIGLHSFLPLVGLSIMLGIAVGVGFILLIVPGVLLALAWCVAVPAFVIEQIPVFDAFGRSADLTRGNRLRIFGLFCIFIIAAIIVSIVLGAIGGVLGFVTGGFFLYVSAAIIQPVVGALVAAMGATLSAVLYMELRRIREGATPQSLAAVFG